jgi:hypothetical protein
LEEGEEWDEDNVEGDDPRDLQAGHGTHGMIYAREPMEGDNSIVSRREKFRQVSHARMALLVRRPPLGLGLGLSLTLTNATKIEVWFGASSSVTHSAPVLTTAQPQASSGQSLLEGISDCPV